MTAARERPRPDGARPGGPTQSVPAEGGGSRPDYVGRRAELDTVIALLTGTAKDGGVAVVIIDGLPGSGKSRFLAEVADKVAVQQVFQGHTFEVRGHEPERRIPLAAASETLRRLIETSPAGGAVHRLLYDSAHASHLNLVGIFEATHQAVREQRTMLLKVDDLQWMDEQSQALCHYLVRAACADSDPLAVLVAVRAGQDASLAESLVALVPATNLLRISLGPLSRDEGMTLVRSVAPSRSDEEAAAMWQRAGGLPFWLQALAAAAEQAGADADPTAAVITGLLRTCSGNTLSVLAAVALLARPVAAGDVARLVSLPAADVDVSVAELVNRGLLLEVAGVVEVAHDLIRSATVNALPSAQLQALTARIAAWLVDRPDEDVAGLLEGLRSQRADGQSGLDIASRLATSPRRWLVGREGLADLCAAADEANPTDPRSLALQREVAALSAELGDHRGALLRWGALAHRLAGAQERARAALEAAKAAYELRLTRQAWAMLQSARAGASGDPVLMVLLDARASLVCRWLDGRPDQARDLARQALGAARALAGEDLARMSLDARLAYLEALAAMCDTEMQDDDLQAMLRLAEEMVTIARGFDERAFLGGLLTQAAALHCLGQTHDAELRCQVVAREARLRVVPSSQAQAAYELGRVLHDQGRLAEASASAAEAEALLDRIAPDSPTRSRMGRLRRCIALSTGDWLSAVTELRRVAADEPDPHVRIGTHLALAHWLARAEPGVRADEIAECVDLAVEDAEQSRCRHCLSEALLRGSAALSWSAQTTEATELMDRWRRGNHRCYGRLAASLGMAEAAAQAADDPAAAAATLDLLIDDADASGLALEALWSSLDQGRLLARTDPPRAVTVLERARSQAGALGARNEMALAEEALRGLGVRTWSRGPAPTGDAGPALSGREREVARLLATGVSNPDIAASLFLSRRTVERHVSNLLSRFGAHNRTELAARLRHDGEDGGSHA